MYKDSRKMFLIFLYFFCFSVGASLSYTFFALITEFPSMILIFLSFCYLLFSFIVVFIHLTKFNYFLKFFLSFIIFEFLLIDIVLLYIFFSKINFSEVNILLIIIPNSIFYIFMFSISEIIYIRFRKLDLVIENESMFENRSKYIQWVNDEYGERTDKIEPKWFLAIGLNVFLALLFFSFLAVAKNEKNSLYISIFLLIFFFSFIGIYLILFQYSTIMKWNFLGFKIKDEVLKNWNKLIKSFMFILGLAVFIPSNYVIFKIEFLKDFLKSLFPVFFEISEKPVERETEEIITYSEGVSSNFESIYSIVKKIIFYVLIVYLLLAFVGGILKLIYKKKIPFWAKFFIFFYENLIGILIKIKEFVLLLISSLMEAFFSKKEEREKEKLSRHFYNLFGNYKKLPTEKQREIETMVKEFVRLIQVASRFVLPYVFYYGPKEYMDKVSEKVKNAEGEIRDVVSIFNESRYSLHLLSEEKKILFRRQIDIIIDKITRLF